MKKCSPVETRKNLESAKSYASIGLDFVCVPVISSGNKEHLVDMAVNALELLAIQAEKDSDDE